MAQAKPDPKQNYKTETDEVNTTKNWLKQREIICKYKRSNGDAMLLNEKTIKREKTGSCVERPSRAQTAMHI